MPHPVSRRGVSEASTTQQSQERWERAHHGGALFSLHPTRRRDRETPDALGDTAH
jgi:hypothetical protein